MILTTPQRERIRDLAAMQPMPTVHPVDDELVALGLVKVEQEEADPYDEMLPAEEHTDLTRKGWQESHHND